MVFEYNPNVATNTFYLIFLLYINEKEFAL